MGSESLAMKVRCNANFFWESPTPHTTSSSLHFIPNAANAKATESDPFKRFRFNSDFNHEAFTMPITDV